MFKSLIMFENNDYKIAIGIINKTISNYQYSIISNNLYTSNPFKKKHKWFFKQHDSLFKVMFI